MSEKYNFDDIFGKLYPSVCLVANNFLHDMDVSQDIAQEVFIKFWKIRSNYNTINSIKTYLYVMVKNSCINYLKKESLKSRYLESSDKEIFENFKNTILEEETYRILYQAINELPEQSAKIMKLTLDGLQNQEISERLGVSVNTVKTLKYNSIKKLRSQLKDFYYIIPLFLGL